MSDVPELSLHDGKPARFWAASLDGHLRPEPQHAALLIIDTQNDFVDGGTSPIAGTTEVLPNLVELLAAFRAADRPIVHVVRLYSGDDVDRVRRTSIYGGSSLVAPGTVGAQIVPALAATHISAPDPIRLLAGGFEQVGPSEVVMWKPRWSAFHRTSLHAYLADQGITTVVIAGCNFPNCPRATIFDASELDYRVLVPSDAVSGVTPVHLDELSRLGVVHARTDDVVSLMRS